jgi:hypothetical protein
VLYWLACVLASMERYLLFFIFDKDDGQAGRLPGLLSFSLSLFPRDLSGLFVAAC